MRRELVCHVDCIPVLQPGGEGRLLVGEFALSKILVGAGRIAEAFDIERSKVCRSDLRQANWVPPEPRSGAPCINCKGHSTGVLAAGCFVRHHQLESGCARTPRGIGDRLDIRRAGDLPIWVSGRSYGPTIQEIPCRTAERVPGNISDRQRIWHCEGARRNRIHSDNLSAGCRITARIRCSVGAGYRDDAVVGHVSITYETLSRCAARVAGTYLAGVRRRNVAKSAYRDGPWAGDRWIGHVRRPGINH